MAIIYHNQGVSWSIIASLLKTSTTKLRTKITEYENRTELCTAAEVG